MYRGIRYLDGGGNLGGELRENERNREGKGERAHLSTFMSTRCATNEDTEAGDISEKHESKI